MNAREEKIIEFQKKALIEELSERWYKFSSQLKEAKKLVEQVEDEIIKTCGHEYEGCGLRVLEVERKGSVDYTAIPELKNIDLDQYRKPSTKFWQIKPSVMQ